MNCYEKDLPFKPTTINFLRYLHLKHIIVTAFNLFCVKSVKTKPFKFKYLGKKHTNWIKFYLFGASPFFQVIFMKNHVKNPLFEGLCYNHKGFELFLNLLGHLRGWKFDRLCILCYPFRFCHRLFWSLPL